VSGSSPGTSSGARLREGFFQIRSRERLDHLPGRLRAAILLSSWDYRREPLCPQQSIIMLTLRDNS
jgi:hypothetical protein